MNLMKYNWDSLNMLSWGKTMLIGKLWMLKWRDNWGRHKKRWIYTMVHKNLRKLWIPLSDISHMDCFLHYQMQEIETNREGYVADFW